MLRSSLLFILALFVPLIGFPQSCGVPDEWLSSTWIFKDVIAEASEQQNKSLTQTGPVLVQWNLSDKCINSDEEELEPHREKCFRFVTDLQDVAIARTAMAELIAERPNSATIIGWAIRDEPDENGHALIFAELHIAGFPVVTLDESDEPKLICGDGQDTYIR